MPRPRSAPATPNPFEALATQQPPGSPGSRRQKKAERAKEHRASTSAPGSPAPAAPLGKRAASGRARSGAPSPGSSSMGIGPSLPWLGSPASECGGLGGLSPGGLPPLRLDDGGQLLEDDLDYQLLLRPDGVSEAAAAAAARIAQREAEADASAGGPAASAEALRAMMDASSRSAAGNSRPGSAGGSGAAAAAGSRPGSAGGDGWEAGEEEDGWADVDDVDTKSLRRLVEDMRRRGWRMQPSGGGHIKCERPYQDVDGSTKLQVYFLCSTPSDVAYIHNVKAAVKRFDRQLLEIRAAAATAAAAAAGGSTGQGGGGRPGV
ncbi:hypothetical protein C2E21_6077 [Chlorella sorokiniana]|uniref:Uncharacterized protein n=1 Tax=Chlorella sorokiniana TaxID=3076 RepID=A0A2P6TM60_CHLSO|nr:hypothetical protein C2E21_6077 [Chlorella sorokiniana]|eukprot:PRW45385.1 hypothetical protein C2E21_6077 [Chlorella sorokiniana]